MDDVSISEHGSAGRSFPTPQNACLTGRCTGSLTAAAVSCSSSPSDLLSIGVHTVVLAFRIGACAWDVGTRICSSRDASDRYQSWTAALSGVSEEELARSLEHFTSDQVCTGSLI